MIIAWSQSKMVIACSKESKMVNDGFFVSISLSPSLLSSPFSISSFSSPLRYLTKKGWVDIKCHRPTMVMVGVVHIFINTPLMHWKNIQQIKIAELSSFCREWTSHMKKETLQELRMPSTVTLDCQVTKIVMNSGSRF